MFGRGKEADAEAQAKLKAEEEAKLEEEIRLKAEAEAKAAAQKEPPKSNKVIFFSPKAAYTTDATTPEMRKKGESFIVHFSEHHFAATPYEASVLKKHTSNGKDFWQVKERVTAPPPSKKIVKEHLTEHDKLHAQADKLRVK